MKNLIVAVLTLLMVSCGSNPKNQSDYIVEMHATTLPDGMSLYEIAPVEGAIADDLSRHMNKKTDIFVIDHSVYFYTRKPLKEAKDNLSYKQALKIVAELDPYGLSLQPKN